MKIITGKTGTNHIASEDDRARLGGIFGTGNYILNVGSKFAATIETANTIRIADGELIMDGTHARVEYGDADSIIIENGNSGYNRIDLIVARYTKVDGIENVEFAVIKGTPSSGTAVQPSCTAGNILEGAELAEVPIYAVALAGVNVISITSQLPVLTTTMDNIYTKAQVDAKEAAINDNINAKDADMSERMRDVWTIANRADEVAGNALSRADTGSALAADALDNAGEALYSATNATRRLDENQSDCNGFVNPITSITDPTNTQLEEQILSLSYAIESLLHSIS